MHSAGPLIDKIKRAGRSPFFFKDAAMSTDINTMQTESPFDAIESWQSKPLIAFEAFLLSEEFRFSNRSSMDLPISHRIKAGSAKVYVSMFNKFIRYLALKNANLLQCQAQDVRSFITEELGSASGETRSRYVRLIERVYDYLHLRHMIDANPATQWVLEMHTNNQKAVTKEDFRKPITTDSDIKRLQNWLYAQGAQAIREGKWKLARDVTMASLSLGTGMRCAELVKLKRSQAKYFPDRPSAERLEFDIPSWASVRTARAHKASAEHDCVDLMELWWKVRWSHDDSQKTTTPTPEVLKAPLVAPLIGGELLFPATAQGKQMKPTTLFVNLKTLGTQAQKDGAIKEKDAWILGSGATGLRRAYIVSQLERGRPPQFLTERLGHFHSRSIRRHLSSTQPSDLR
jgi:integrase